MDLRWRETLLSAASPDSSLKRPGLLWSDMQYLNGKRDQLRRG